jgi:hypothetical protein
MTTTLLFVLLLPALTVLVCALILIRFNHTIEQIEDTEASGDLVDLQRFYAKWEDRL